MSRASALHSAPCSPSADYEISASSAGLYTHQLYGDWCAVFNAITDPVFFKTPDISAWHSIRGVDRMVEFATAMGNSTDAQFYATIAAAARTAYVAAYWHPNNATWSAGYPINQILALTLPGVIPAGHDGVVASASHTQRRLG